MLVGKCGHRQIRHGVEAHRDQFLWGDVPGGWTSRLVIAEFLIEEVQWLGTLLGWRRIQGALHEGRAVASSVGGEARASGGTELAPLGLLAGGVPSGLFGGVA